MPVSLWDVQQPAAAAGSSCGPAHKAHQVCSNHAGLVPGRRVLGTDMADGAGFDVCAAVSTRARTNGPGDGSSGLLEARRDGEDAPGDWEQRRAGVKIFAEGSGWGKRSLGVGLALRLTQ